MSESDKSANKKGVAIEGRVRQMVYNVYKFLDSEKQLAQELLKKMNTAGIQQTPDGDIPISGELYRQIEDFLKASVRTTNRVVLSTGISKNTITRIKQERLSNEAAGILEFQTPKRKPRGKTKKRASQKIKTS